MIKNIKENLRNICETLECRMREALGQNCAGLRGQDKQT